MRSKSSIYKFPIRNPCSKGRTKSPHLRISYWFLTCYQTCILPNSWKDVGAGRRPGQVKGPPTNQVAMEVTCRRWNEWWMRRKWVTAVKVGFELTIDFNILDLSIFSSFIGFLFPCSSLNSKAQATKSIAARSRTAWGGSNSFCILYVLSPDPVN